jgi:hypothetical protein
MMIYTLNQSFSPPSRSPSVASELESGLVWSGLVSPVGPDRSASALTLVIFLYDHLSLVVIGVIPMDFVRTRWHFYS